MAFAQRTASRLTWSSGYTSGGAPLNRLNGTSIIDYDLNLTEINGKFAFHIADIDGGLSQSLPDVVVPATNPGSVNWLILAPYLEAEWVPAMTTGVDVTANDQEKLYHETDPPVAYFGDRVIKAFDGTNQWLVSQKLQWPAIHWISPQSWDDSVRDGWRTATNQTGFPYHITRILCTSDISTTITLSIYTSNTNATTLSTIGTIAIDTAGTGIYYKTVAASSLITTVIPAQAGIVFDFHNTHDPKQGFCQIEGWYNAAN